MSRSCSFKKVVVCHTNDFKPEINDKIKVWIEANGGAFSKELTPGVTHLVASSRAWKRYYPLVRQARRMRTVRIVRFDWLEDSLHRTPIRALPVDKYLFEQTKLKFKRPTICRPSAKVEAKLPEKKAGGAAIYRGKQMKVGSAEYNQAIEELKTDMRCGEFHPYCDVTGFIYIVNLLRYDALKERLERFRLKLYESNEMPHTYACYAQYTRPAVQRQVLVLAPPGSTWVFAWDAFERFFVKKTCTSWNNRPQNGTEVTFDNSDVDRQVAYHYQAPAIGDLEGIRRQRSGQTFTGRDSTDGTDELQDTGSKAGRINVNLRPLQDNQTRSSAASSNTAVVEQGEDVMNGSCIDNVGQITTSYPTSMTGFSAASVNDCFLVQ